MGGSSEILADPVAELESAIVLDPSSLAVCLVSGGMDSCVTAAIAREENDELAFLHVTYGQRTAAREAHPRGGVRAGAGGSRLGQAALERDRPAAHR